MPFHVHRPPLAQGMWPPQGKCLSPRANEGINARRAGKCLSPRANEGIIARRAGKCLSSRVFAAPRKRYNRPVIALAAGKYPKLPENGVFRAAKGKFTLIFSARVNARRRRKGCGRRRRTNPAVSTKRSPAVKQKFGEIMTKYVLRNGLQAIRNNRLLCA